MKRESMKRRAAAFVALSLAGVLVSSAAALSQTMFHAQVPFPFAVGDVWLPAGNYVVRHDKDWLRLQSGTRTHVFIARQDFGPRVTEPKLSFKITSEGHRLCKVPGLLTNYCK